MRVTISLNGSEAWVELPDMPTEVVIDFIKRLIMKGDEVKVKRVDR